MEDIEENAAGDEIATGGNAGINRRNLIKTGAAVGAAAWVLPQVVSMSSALASPIHPPGCVFSSFTNFHGLPSGDPVPGFLTYFGSGVPLIGLWFTAPGTASIDAVTFPQYGSGGFTDTATSPPVIIDLAGTPGPGGITKQFDVNCDGDYRVKFQRRIADDGTFSVTIAGMAGGPVTQNFSGAGTQYDSVPFIAAAGDTITVTFFTINDGNGNELVGNILVEYI